jgi:hypothetical protein
MYFPQMPAAKSQHLLINKSITFLEFEFIERINLNLNTRGNECAADESSQGKAR